jgi:hypothetical protein
MTQYFLASIIQAGSHLLPILQFFFFFETPVSSKRYSCGIFDDFNGFMTPLTFEINKEQISGGGLLL